nr:phosphatase PAP2 family protein [Bacillus sp. FJAT-47783]
MIFFTTVGSIKVIGPLTVIISVYFIWKRKWLPFIFLYINLFSVRAFNRFLKELFHRERPDLNRIIDVGEFSFPSGHAMNSTAIYGFFIYLWIIQKPGREENKFYFIAPMLFIFLIGISRVYVGVHYVTDILAGFAAGTVWLLIIIAIFQFVRQKL